MKKYDIYNNWSTLSPLIFAAVITWIPFYIFEIFIPYLEEKTAYKEFCEKSGGFVYEAQNEGRKCIKKDFIIIDKK